MGYVMAANSWLGIHTVKFCLVMQGMLEAFDNNGECVFILFICSIVCSLMREHLSMMENSCTIMGAYKHVAFCFPLIEEHSLPFCKSKQY